MVKKSVKKKVAKKKPVKKKIAKKSVRKKAVKKVVKSAEKKAVEIGRVTHFFDHVSVAVVEIKNPLRVGEKIRVKGATTDFEQKVASMQIDHDKIEKAKKGDAIGLKVKGKVRPNDAVYLVD